MKRDGNRIGQLLPLPLRSGVAVFAAGFLATGCTISTPENPDYQASAPPAEGQQPPAAIEVVEELQGTLNYDGLRSDGLCQGGGERPCFAPIRTEPFFVSPGSVPSSNYLNPGTYTEDAGGNRVYTEVTWPYEGSDTFGIVCRVVGDNVHGYDPDQASNVWDVVAIPAELTEDGVERVGYMPERWVEVAPNKLITDCSETENPWGAPIAQTPTRNFEP